MTGVKLRQGVILFEPLSQSCKFFLRFMVIKQMEATDNSFNWPRTGGKDIL